MKIDKGFFIIGIVGFGFMYLVNNVVGTIESENPSILTKNSKRAKELAQYYKVDYNGDPMLDLTRVGIDQGKNIWIGSPLEAKVMKYFPDFLSMEQMIENQITESPFKKFLLKKLKIIEYKYTAGEMSLDSARDAVTHLD